jgi:hypothetical protein
VATFSSSNGKASDQIQSTILTSCEHKI